MRLLKQHAAAKIGVVSYCEGVSGIWSGMRDRLLARDFDLTFRLFDTYEQQNSSLIAGEIDIAWNGPLAHIQLERSTNGTNIPLGMRDVDRDFASLLIANKHVSPTEFKNGSTVVAGTRDSPQAYILPFAHFKEHGIDLKSLQVVRYDRDLGKHGDTALGELEVLKHLVADSGTRGVFGLVSKLEFDRCKNKHDLRIVQRFPHFDHCQFDCLPAMDPAARVAFQHCLWDMDISHAEDAPVMREEGIHQRWMPARESGYDLMRRALNMTGDDGDYHFASLTAKHTFSGL